MPSPGPILRSWPLGWRSGFYFGDPSLQGVQDGQDGSLYCGWDSVSEQFRDRWMRDRFEVLRNYSSDGVIREPARAT